MKNIKKIETIVHNGKTYQHISSLPGKADTIQKRIRYALKRGKPVDAIKLRGGWWIAAESKT